MTTMPFGKWKDRDLAEVPSDYLNWMLRTCKLSSGLRQAVALEMQSRGEPIPKPPPVRVPLGCNRCGSSAVVHDWLQTRNGRRQIRRSCLRCGSFLGFAPQVPPFLTEAERRASPTAILDVLTELEALGVELQSDGASCWVRGEDYFKVPRELHAKIRQCKHTLASMLGRTPMMN